MPEQWPHVSALFRRHGFKPAGTETVLIADLSEVCGSVGEPALDLKIRRSVGINVRRCSAMRDGEGVGYIEVERLDRRERSVGAAFADIGNLWVHEEHRRQGIAGQLLQYAARWLRQGGAEQLLAYTVPAEVDLSAFLRHSGFETATNTERWWTRSGKLE